MTILEIEKIITVSRNLKNFVLLSFIYIYVKSPYNKLFKNIIICPYKTLYKIVCVC